MPLRHGMAMELRHLRYFVAVVEEGSLTTAAERRLHTSQPSLSRQMRDLEYEVGAELLSRSVHGVELTAAGKAFLDHARLALMQADAAVEAARRAAQPSRQTFAIGFQTGHEMNWPPQAMHVLRDVTEDSRRRAGVDIKLAPGVDNMGMAMPLVASTRGVALMPAYAKNLLPWSVVSRPLEGEAPTIDVAVGYSKSNTSPILKLFLSRLDELVGPNQKH